MSSPMRTGSGRAGRRFGGPGYLRGSVPGGLGIARCAAAAWQLRRAWEGGVAYRGSGVDRGPGWRSRPVALPAAVCRVVG